MRDRTLAVTFLLAAGLVATAPANADPIFEGGPLGRLEATAAFSMVGDKLQLVLTNTSGFDVMRRNEILTAVFFDSGGTLAPFSATLTDPSGVLFDESPADGNVGGEWAYNTGIGKPGTTRGIGAAGLGGYFGIANFNGPELQGRPSGLIGGINYGVTSRADNPLTGRAPVAGANALIKSSVTFLLDVNDGFTLDSVDNVVFQYGARRVAPSLQGVKLDGTNTLTEMVFHSENGTAPVPEVPEPATLSLFGLGLTLLTRRVRRGLHADRH